MAALSREWNQRIELVYKFHKINFVYELLDSTQMPKW